MTLQVWMDGRILPAHDVTVSPFAHALHYGTGVFEGIRCYPTDTGAAVFRLPEHAERMRRGAEVLGLELDPAVLSRAILETLRANGQRDAYIRPIMFYGTGGLRLDTHELSQHLLVATLPWNSHFGDAGAPGIRLGTSPWRRNPSSSLPPLKLCGGYVNSVLAKRDATRRGLDEALFVDEAGLVVECPGENVFMVKGGAVTSVDHPDALPGITRATVIELSGAESRPVTLAELRQADEVFVTGTSAEVTLVGELDGRALGPSPVSRALAERYAGLVRGREPAYAEWLTEAGEVAVR
jgi:branched-chain amino acid aminotransferase